MLSLLLPHFSCLVIFGGMSAPTPQIACNHIPAAKLHQAAVINLPSVRCDSAVNGRLAAIALRSVAVMQPNDTATCSLLANCHQRQDANDAIVMLTIMAPRR